MLKKRYLKKRNELKASKQSGTSAEAVTKAERNFKPYVFMAWLEQYLQMREGRTNIAAATREDDNEMITQRQVKDSAMLRVLLAIILRWRIVTSQ